MRASLRTPLGTSRDFIRNPSISVRGTRYLHLTRVHSSARTAVTMPINIRPADAADLPRIASLSDAGFKDHEWSRAMYRVHDSEGNIARYLFRQTKAFNTGKSTFFVAVDGDPGDPDAPIVGYSRWEVTREQQLEEEWNVPYEAVPVPEGANAEANDRMARPMHDMRLKHYKGRPMVLLNFLVVEPAYQKRGVGAALIAWGLSEADKLGLPAYLEATDAGISLYLRSGFEPIDTINEDLSMYGVPEPCIITVMRRPAKARG